MMYKCPNCHKIHDKNGLFTYINNGNTGVEGFCSEACIVQYRKKYDKSRKSGGGGLGGSVMKTLGVNDSLRGLEDNVRQMGGGLFVDIAKLLFKPVRWLLGLILMLLWKFVVLLAKLAWTGIKKGFFAVKAAVSAKAAARAAAKIAQEEAPAPEAETGR
jgi:hypothetical protein